MIPCIILNTGPNHDPQRGHLHIILNNECEEGNHLLVPISSRHAKCDLACLLGEGDHPFIIHDSFVFYARAQIYAAKTIKEKIVDGDITHRGQLDHRVFGFVCKGLMETRHLPPKAKAYYQQNSAN